MLRSVLGTGWSRLARLNSARAVQYDSFADRHIGPSRLEKQQMLDFLGFNVSSPVYEKISPFRTLTS